MTDKEIEIFPGLDFGIGRKITEVPDRSDFFLHNHDDLYEVVMLLNGDCEFYVEGNTYPLSVKDIIFTRPFEMHKMNCLSEIKYDRIVLYIRSDYFKNHNCEEFKNIFRNRTLGKGNCISYDAKKRDLSDCIYRIYRYSEQQAYKVCGHGIYEFLYLMNKYKNEADNFHVEDDRVRNMIVYINRHLSENLSLDTLAGEFFAAKNYLCRVFKQYTGYTINQYIIYKRVMLAQELYRSGQTLTQASMNAGFNSYANFYKAYVKQIGESPSEMK